MPSSTSDRQRQEISAFAAMALGGTGDADDDEIGVSPMNQFGSIQLTNNNNDNDDTPSSKIAPDNIFAQAIQQEEATMTRSGTFALRTPGNSISGGEHRNLQAAAAALDDVTQEEDSHHHPLSPLRQSSNNNNPPYQQQQPEDANATPWVDTPMYAQKVVFPRPLWFGGGGITTTGTNDNSEEGVSKNSSSSKNERVGSNVVVDVNDYLPPLPLVVTVLACSGFIFLYAFRDVFATGRVIGGAPDDALLVSFYR